MLHNKDACFCVANGDLNEYIHRETKDMLSISKTSVSQRSFVASLVNYGKVRSSSYATFETLSEKEKPVALSCLMRFQLAAYFCSLASRRHVAQAILSSRDEATQRSFCRYLSDRYWHSDLVKHALLRSGFSKEQLDNQVPSWETRDCLDYLEHLAQEDLEAYTMCLSIMNSCFAHDGVCSDFQSKWLKIKYLNLLSEAVIDVYMQCEGQLFMQNKVDLHKEILDQDVCISQPRQEDLCEKIDCFINKLENFYSSIFSVDDDFFLFLVKT